MKEHIILKLGKVDYEGNGRKNCLMTVEIKIKTEPATTAPYLDTDLKPLGGQVTELSISGNVWNPRQTDIYDCGQNVDIIRQYFGKNKRIARLCDIWERYHRNGMNAGTREQNEALKDFTTDDRLNYHTRQCEYLESKNLLDVPIPEESRKNFDYMANKYNGDLPKYYRYGTAWLHESVPAEVLDEVRAIIAEYNGGSAEVK